MQVNNAATTGLIIAKPQELVSFTEGAGFVSIDISNL